MPTAKKAPAKKTAPSRQQVVKSQPRNVEIRIDGKIRFANLCYDPTFEIADDGSSIWFRADLEPTWVEQTLPPPTRFVTREDPRDGDEIIMRVHSGRRDIVEPGDTALDDEAGVDPETEEL